MKGAHLLKHGLRYAPEYNSWVNMKARCARITHPRYHEWGGRGIAVCERWAHDFAAFYADMGPRPSAGYSIERKDNDGDYCPSNCVWATPKQQSVNRPSWVRLISFNGSSKTVTDWAADVGISRESLRGRINDGWPIPLALTLPKGSRLNAAK